MLLESAKGHYFVPRVLPQVLTYDHSCCVLPTGAQATCISQQRAVFEKNPCCFRPYRVTIYIFSIVILSPYLLTLTITTQVCEKGKKKKPVSSASKGMRGSWQSAEPLYVAPELALDAHVSELQCSILRFAFCKGTHTCTGPRVPRFGKAHLLRALPRLCSCSSLHESFWVSLLPAGERQQLAQRWVFVHVMEQRLLGRSRTSGSGCRSHFFRFSMPPLLCFLLLF